MNDSHIKGLIGQTITAPRLAARQLLTMGLPHQWLWSALALMSVLNSIVYSVSLRISPPSDPAAIAMIPPVFHSPVLFAIFLLGGLVISVFTLLWVGQIMGGTAKLGDILVLIAWLQVLRLLLQVAVLVLTLAVPVVGVLLVLVASFWGIYILAGFINEAHGFDSWTKSVGVMILALIAMVVGLTIILSVIGIAALGVA